MLEVIFGAIANLVRIAAKLAAGKISDDEARAECVANGVRITEASPSKRKARVVIADANHVFKHDPRDPSTVAAPERAPDR